MFFGLFQGFIFTMLLAVTTDNLGVMWRSPSKARRSPTVFLVNLHNTQTSLEAAYKYLIISSVGIALAFIGTVLMYYAGAARAGEIAVNRTSERSRRRLAQSAGRAARVRLRAHRLRHESRPRADRHLAARCSQRSTRAP
jgi:formate hydrogenlyase subunit 3/multisubunit Na+/H+ antiporter MnhD subunit